MENKKVKNAQKRVYNGIKFKSDLEVSVYKALLQEGFNAEYEKHTYVIYDGFTPKVPFYTKNKFKRKNHNIEVISPKTVKDMRPLDSITYTPDFVFKYGDKTIIVEAKGKANDVYPYKMKMFRYHIQKEYFDPGVSNYEIWEIFTLTQLKECINLLKKSQTQ